MPDPESVLLLKTISRVSTPVEARVAVADAAAKLFSGITERNDEEQRRANGADWSCDWRGRLLGLVSGQRPINRESIVEELVRLGRQKGDGVEDEIFMQAATLVRKGI